jgi:hypothetical protein
MVPGAVEPEQVIVVSPAALTLMFVYVQEFPETPLSVTVSACAGMETIRPPSSAKAAAKALMPREWDFMFIEVFLVVIPGTVSSPQAPLEFFY